MPAQEREVGGFCLRSAFESVYIIDNFIVIAPPPPAVRAGGAGGLVLPEETAAHASETLAPTAAFVSET